MQMHEARGPEPMVSVLITTYQGEAAIARTLESLASQTMPLRAIEVVVVANGPQGRTPEIVAAFRGRHPAMTVRVLETSQPGLSNARNLGVRAARGRFLTYVDDDDYVSPSYLATLVAAARPGVVPVAFIGDIKEGGPGRRRGPEFANYFSSKLLPLSGRLVDPERVPAALSVNAGKLVPTALARTLDYDTSLRSGEDFVYWASLFERTAFRLRVTDISRYAVYFRTVRQGSLGRQARSYDFSVTQRLDCIAALERIPAERPEVATVVRAMTGGQVEFVRQFLQDHPEERDRVVEDIRTRGLRGVPTDRLDRVDAPA